MHKKKKAPDAIAELLKISVIFLEIFGNESEKAEAKSYSARVLLCDNYPAVKIDSALKVELLSLFHKNGDTKIFRKFLSSVIAEEKIAKTTGANLYSKNKDLFDSFIGKLIFIQF